MDTPAARLKQRLTVSYAEYREMEKSWTAARELVRMYNSVLHSSSQQAGVKAACGIGRDCCCHQSAIITNF